MTEKEAIDEITSEPKYYLYANPPMNQSTASNFIASWRKGMSKQSTVEAFLNRFGYVIMEPTKWGRQLEGKPKELKTK